MLIEITRFFFFYFLKIINIIIPNPQGVVNFRFRHSNDLRRTLYANRSDQSTACHVFSNKPKTELAIWRLRVVYYITLYTSNDVT